MILNIVYYLANIALEWKTSKIAQLSEFVVQKLLECHYINLKIIKQVEDIWVRSKVFNESNKLYSSAIL